MQNTRDQATTWSMFWQYSHFGAIGLTVLGYPVWPRLLLTLLVWVVFEFKVARGHAPWSPYASTPATEWGVSLVHIAPVRAILDWWRANHVSQSVLFGTSGLWISSECASWSCSYAGCSWCLNAFAFAKQGTICPSAKRVRTVGNFEAGSDPTIRYRCRCFHSPPSQDYRIWLYFTDHVRLQITEIQLYCVYPKKV